MKNINIILDELIRKRDILEENIYAKIQGNSENNIYIYSQEDRENMKKELKIIENKIEKIEQKYF